MGACMRTCVCAAEDAYVLLDLPGQVELFTLQPSFKRVIQCFTDQWGYRLAAVHLVDVHLCTDAPKWVTCLFNAPCAHEQPVLLAFLSPSGTNAHMRCQQMSCRRGHIASMHMSIVLRSDFMGLDCACGY